MHQPRSFCCTHHMKWVGDLRVHVVFKRQDDREGRGLEGTFCDGLDHLLKTQRREIIGYIILTCRKLCWMLRNKVWWWWHDLVAQCDDIVWSLKKIKHFIVAHSSYTVDARLIYSQDVSSVYGVAGHVPQRTSPNLLKSIVGESNSNSDKIGTCPLVTWDYGLL